MFHRLEDRDDRVPALIEVSAPPAFTLLQAQAENGLIAQSRFATGLLS
jgi:hypothetical protein